MVFKILLFLILIFLVYIIFFKKNRVEDSPSKNNKKNRPEELMLECNSCKVYFSKDEGILSNGKYFCCKECVK